MAEIAEHLERADTVIAVVGATDTPWKYGGKIYCDLKTKGFQVRGPFASKGRMFHSTKPSPSNAKKGVSAAETALQAPGFSAEFPATPMAGRKQILAGPDGVHYHASSSLL